MRPLEKSNERNGWAGKTQALSACSLEIPSWGASLWSKYNKWLLKSLDYLKSCLENVNSSHYRKLKVNLWWIVLFFKMWRQTYPSCEFGGLLDARQGVRKASFNCEHGTWHLTSLGLSFLSEIRGFELITLKVLSSEVQRALTLTWDPPPWKPPLFSTWPQHHWTAGGTSTQEPLLLIGRWPSRWRLGTGQPPEVRAQLSRASPSQEQQGWPRP